MKRVGVIVCLLGSMFGFSQAKKPTLMVVPSDAWCNKNGYMTEIDNQGQKIKVVDYRKALLSDELQMVISKINTLMTDRGFPMKDLQAAIKNIDQDNAETSVKQSKTAASITESPFDKLKRVAKADIIVQITYSIATTGPKKTVVFNLQGLDAYTDKQIVGAQGTGKPSFSAEVPVLLEEAVISQIDRFNVQLQKYFDDMFANGREVTIRIRKFDSWDKDLDEEVKDGVTISELIEEWVKKQAVKGRFSTTEATENMMFFEQVRIPIYDDKGNASDTRAFVRKLQKYLAAEPYKVSSKLTMKGLGQATLILGEK